MTNKKNKSFFGKMSERIGQVLKGKTEIDDDLLEELEEVLITSDIGMETTMHIMDRIRGILDKENISSAETLKVIMKKIMVGLVNKDEAHSLTKERPLVILVIGINGGGKTTTIGKIAHKLITEGDKVQLVAADTFRAAAAAQLEIWGERVGANVIKHKEGADPSAVIFDGINSAKARGTDVLICDTAGRLQNKKNLMIELEKMNKVISREYPEAHRETLLVLDATTGKNAISQAKEFSQVADISGIVITKLDGTGKGGIAITIADEFDMPIKFVGTGEKMEDIKEFSPEAFIGGIFNE